MPTTKTLDEWWNDAGNSRDTDILLVLEEEYNKLKSASDDTLATLEKENLELKEQIEVLSRDMKGSLSFIEEHQELKRQYKELGKENEKLKDKLEVLTAQANKIDDLIKLRSK